MYTSCAFLKLVTAVTHAGAQQILLEHETFRIVARFTHCNDPALAVDDDARHRISRRCVTQRFCARLHGAGGKIAFVLFRADAGFVPFQRGAAGQQQQSCD